MGDGRFVKGQPSWNKGLKGIMKPNKTSFNKGSIPWNKKEPIKKICPKCGKEFFVRPSLERIVCCSFSCARSGKSSPMKGRKASLETRKKQSIAKYGFRGEKHWNWKGGYSESYRLRRSVDYKNWRRDVFIRDNFTCQECGINHTYITAHHIKSWRDYPNLRFNINNGKTLCEDCHKKTDNYKGRPKKCKV